jgi:thioester reductase-like protein
VSRVICLSRASSHADSLKRVQESLATRLLELNSAQAAKITSLAADVNALLLGLAQSEYDDLRTSVTTVLHNAWPVNFVLSTESFDAHIGGAVNLLNLTLSSPRLTAPAFLFSSSVSTRQGRPDPVSAEDFADSPQCASPMGYGRSKWVVERICRDAPKATNGRARVGVLRIGQLVGDTQRFVLVSVPRDRAYITQRSLERD